MHNFDPDLAEIRFGYGLSPVLAPPQGVDELLAGLAGPDRIQQRFPIESFSQFRMRMVAAQKQHQIRRENRGTELAQKARKQQRVVNREARVAMIGWLGQTMLRRTHTPSAFRERLVAFWADHFTALGKQGVIRRATSPYIEEAIRPFVASRFADLLQATVMHPLMLDYLDQHKSIGPNSARAAKLGASAVRGVNENLAREVLELHTLGVEGPYSQTDVTQLAELFTGLSFGAPNGFVFRKDFAEPGAETVMGVSYGTDASVQPIRDVLNNLAMHPATARHLARKLAVHFTSDTPDPSLIDALEAAYLAHDGHLAPVYQALLEHPAAWDPVLSNVKLPIDFVSSTLRALAVPKDHFQGRKEKWFRRWLGTPLAQMGQVWERPQGPDGWAESDAAWITPQGVAHRVMWAMAAPPNLVRGLPDPRMFVDKALGRFANETVRFAAASADNRPEAIGLVLMSPAFQRR